MSRRLLSCPIVPFPRPAWHQGYRQGANFPTDGHRLFRPDFDDVSFFLNEEIYQIVFFLLHAFQQT